MNVYVCVCVCGIIRLAKIHYTVQCGGSSSLYELIESEVLLE